MTESERGSEGEETEPRADGERGAEAAKDGGDRWMETFCCSYKSSLLKPLLCPQIVLVTAERLLTLLIEFKALRFFWKIFNCLLYYIKPGTS